MYTITKKQLAAKSTYQIDVKAPQIAKKHEAGHFIILRVDEKGERVPLTIVERDLKEGTVTLIFQVVGVSTEKLSRVPEGGQIADILGPLGNPTEIPTNETVLCAGGGVGVAVLYPIIKAMYENGNRVISIIAARDKESLILEDEVAAYSHELHVMTDDGSHGKKGLITDGMEEIIKQEHISRSEIIGPAIMMKYASMLTEKYNIPSIASLNTIMVCGTGMCGSCRVSVGEQIQFACADGPEFDAHKIDFDEILTRERAYKDIEKQDYEQYLETVKLKKT